MNFTRIIIINAILLVNLVQWCSAQILNAYAKVTSVTSNSVLALSNVNIANHTFTVGGQVVVMQMQDDVIGTNTTNASTFGDLSSIANAGVYEVRTIAAVSPTSGTPTSVTITPALANTFNTGANSSVQMISLRDLGANYTTSANITGLAWDGNVGGVIALSVTNTLTLNHRVLADGIGFAGGLYSNNNGGPVCTSPSATVYIANDANRGYKGEGIYKNTNTTFNNARGKLLNGGGGGNHHNGGGGGGGNFTAGGQGGNGYNNCTTFPGGGLGGLSLSASISASRVFMGGGGGGGQQNNSQNSSGGDGGGIILIKANQIETSTTCGSSIRISANGQTAITGGNDGMGGGGAGGSIVIEANSFSINASCPLLVRANGGNGGSVTDGAAHAGGGGGGQGVIIYSIAQPTANVTTQTNNGTAGSDNSGGSTSGGNGSGTSGSGIIGSSSGPLPIELVFFKAEPKNASVLLTWQTASEKNNKEFVIERSQDGLNFTPILSRKGAGSSSTFITYEMPDSNPLRGINYYRLKQIDFDGSFNYSAIIVVQLQEEVVFSLFPNPLNSKQTLQIKTNKTSFDASTKIKIFDFAGKLVLDKTVSFNDSNETAISDLQLPEGIYVVRFESYDVFLSEKLIIQN